MADCAQPITRLAADGPAAWQGLPSGCRVADLAPALDCDESLLGAAPLGERNALFLPALLGDEVTAQVWLDAEEEDVVMVELEEPPFAATGAALTAAVGEPAARLDTWIGMLEADGGEWVWPERGLAAFVEPETDRVERLALFPPTTADGYEQGHRRHDLRPRKFPRGA